MIFLTFDDAVGVSGDRLSRAALLDVDGPLVGVVRVAVEQQRRRHERDDDERR